MMAFKLYNTLANRKEQFKSREPGQVKLFTCGPSVYRKQHLGNFRTFLYEDVLQKYLEYQSLKVERVIIFTDVEDKAIEEARGKGVSLEAQRGPVEKIFFQECNLLKIKLPDQIPRATSGVDSAVDLIKRLIDNGHAYWHQGEVFFDPLTYPGFGRIYGLDMSRWPKRKIHFRKDTYPGQRWNRGDFILWHKRSKKKGEVWWDTELGQGRPAWNIQDAAIIKKHLGFEIDIHTGGRDNLYRHHDYTLAIMEGASGKKFCPWWLHGGELIVKGEKMSKSKGNVTYVDDLLDLGFEPFHLRFFLLYGPYGNKLDLRLSAVELRAGHLDRVRHLVKILLEGRNKNSKEAGKNLAAEMRQTFEKGMNDNLDYAGAFDGVTDSILRAVHVDKTAGLSSGSRKQLGRVLADIDRVLGVLGCEQYI